MAEFSPNSITHYRAATESHAKSAGIVLNRRLCSKCKQPKETSGGKLIRGTSRWNPSVFLCAACRKELGL